MKIFKNDGSVNETELKIVNFRPVGTNKNGEAEISNKQWEEVQYSQDFMKALGVSQNFEITVACGLTFHWSLRTLRYESTLKCSQKSSKENFHFTLD